MKEFSEMGKKQKHKVVKEAKLTRRAHAKAKGSQELSTQKLREKANEHMKKHMR